MNLTKDDRTKAKPSQCTYRFSECCIHLYFVVCTYNGFTHVQDQNQYQSLTPSALLHPYEVQQETVLPKHFLSRYPPFGSSQTSKLAQVDVLNPNILGRNQENPSSDNTANRLLHLQNTFLAEVGIYLNFFFFFLQQEYF